MKTWYELYFGDGAKLLATSCVVVKDRIGRILVAGMPENNEVLPEAEQHNCDQMGCGSAGPHIIGFIQTKEMEK